MNCAKKPPKNVVAAIVPDTASGSVPMPVARIARGAADKRNKTLNIPSKEKEKKNKKENKKKENKKRERVTMKFHDIGEDGKKTSYKRGRISPWDDRDGGRRVDPP